MILARIAMKEGMNNTAINTSMLFAFCHMIITLNFMNGPLGIDRGSIVRIHKKDTGIHHHLLGS